MNDDEWLGTSTLGAVRLNDALARAEKAESERDYLQGLVDGSDYLKRAKKAEARLAELVNEVKAWMVEQPYATPGLYNILAEYDGGEHG